MDKSMKTILMLCLAMALSVLAVQAQEPVSIESLLHEMVDRDAVARYPKTDFRLKQQSSYSRASKTPEEPKGWFTNHDYNSSDRDQNFIRIEENRGRKEWVLMDHEGPGAIVRTWMPWRNQKSGQTNTEMTIYLDGAEEPIIVGNMLGVFDGSGLIPYPLAHPSLRSAVSFFPIPYAKSCKVTVNERPFFHQFTFREYSKGTEVKTFTMADFEKAKPLTEKTGRALLDPSSGEHKSPRARSGLLEPGKETTLTLPSGVPAAIRALMVKLGNYDDPTVTRKVILKAEFDGKETVWCPIGDFFGCGIGLNPVQGWYSSVDQDGSMRSRWVMPFQNSASISLLNLSDKPVDFQLEALSQPWTWDDRTMTFHAAWRGQYPVPTRPHSDWNYVPLKGRGVYVGDALTIMNPVEKWWGEGDEKIWVDGEAFPSIFGTGTEDYYAYSWGGRSTDFYEHPFHAQSRAHVYNKLNRKTDVTERNTQGFSTETRTRALDTMPFGKSLQLDMEVWSGTDCNMGYQVGCYWYAFDGTTSNRKPDPEGALSIPPLPEAVEEKLNSLPNVVLIFADDLGYGDLGCYGATKVQTPNIDRLAKQGRRFTDAHSASAVCTPSRYALLTGEYPVRGNGGKGVWGPSPVTSGLIIDTDKLTLADVFKRKGYATAVLGKWHLGFGEGTNRWQEPLRPGPQDLGFDYYFGLPVVNSAPPYVYVENDRVVGGDPADPLVYVGRNAKGATPITPIPPEASQRTANMFRGAVEAHKLYNDYTVGQVLSGKAVDWIKDNKEKPFFLYLATTHIHHPFTPGKNFQGSSDAELYGDFIQELDWMVGRVTQCLEQQGLSDNTLVIFTSDNGGMMNLGGRNAVRAGHKMNGDLLGFKFGVWEGGHRVPFIAKWPGKIEAGSESDQLICNVDMLATCMALTRQNPETAQGKDSVNVLPALLENPQKPIRKDLLLAARSERHLSIRKGKWMYIPARGSGGFKGSKPDQHAWGGPAAVALVGGVNSEFENGTFKPNAAPAQLYDLEADVNQTKNLYREYPDVVREMEALLKTYQP